MCFDDILGALLHIEIAYRSTLSIRMNTPKKHSSAQS